MQGKYKLSLFLTSSEREMLLNTADKLMDLDVDTMEEAMEAQTLAELLVKLVLGKGPEHYPIMMQKVDDDGEKA